MFFRYFTYFQVYVYETLFINFKFKKIWDQKHEFELVELDTYI